MNVSRSVQPAEYREVLMAVAEHRQPDFAADTKDSRAAKGREGLLKDIYPALVWAQDHADLLASRITDAANARILARANTLATQNLPERVQLNVPILLVIGGRAGAAASEDGIYFDVLANSYRDPEQYPKRREITEFVAHELHHIGLGRILSSREGKLHPNAGEQLAFNFLRTLVMEGSASYLINGHRDLKAMHADPHFASSGNDQSHLKAVQEVLAGVEEQGWGEERYSQAIAEFVGNTPHITGAAMLDVIYRARGRGALMKVLGDLRKLLLSYNASLAPTSTGFRFLPKLAQQTASLGDRR